MPPCNGKCLVVIGPVEQSPFQGRGNESHLESTPGLRVPQTPSQQPSLPAFKLCAFDHLLGLKIFYAKSSWAPEVKDGGADTLASGTPSSPCSATPPV